MARDTQINQDSVTRTRGNVDRTITSLSGSSQELVPASDLPRKRLIIKNGAALVGINFTGGSAAIGAAGTLTLQAYEGVALTGKDCPNTQINVIGTATNYVTCYEGR